MKKILGSILIVGVLFINSTNASFMYDKIEPVCWINGETFTSSSAWKSDTSSWKILIAYSGKCKETVKLSKKYKAQIYKIVSNYFSKKYWITNWDSNWISINSDWKNMIQNKLFPKIKQIISEEIKKEKPNFRKIAVLNYLVKTIWYDYYISIPR